MAAFPSAPLTLTGRQSAAECYNYRMDASDIRFYRERWKAVEEIERQELRAMTIEEHWRKLNAIARFAIETNMEIPKNSGEMEVFLRWTKIKVQYETGQKTGAVSRRCLAHCLTCHFPTLI